MSCDLTMKKIRIATRSSMLATTQAQIVGEAIRAVSPAVEVEYVLLTTRGDATPGALSEIGGKGLFTVELEQALRDRRVDIAVHSAKDMPACLADDLIIAAVPPRADARDAIISRDGLTVDQLETGATVGTSSLRRSAQLRIIRPDLNIVPIRGNIETRIAKVLSDDSSGMDATVLAMAGLVRSGLDARQAQYIQPISIDQCIPAAGQGFLAIEIAASNESVLPLIASLNHSESYSCLVSERSVVRALGAGCQSCLGVHIYPSNGQFKGLAMAARPDGSDMIRFSILGQSAQIAADKLIESLASRGGGELLSH